LAWLVVRLCYVPSGQWSKVRRSILAQAMRGWAICWTISVPRHQKGLGPIWPGRLSVGGVNLGDVWRHSQISGPGITAGLVPFHKLSQWLTYSLIEPIIAAGITVTGVDELTGLAEYRNGGLLLDLELLMPRHDAMLTQTYTPEAEIIVEWRALTIALLDRLAVQVRDYLGVAAEAYPLAKILEGGTWRAGRRIAREKRPDGSPPLRLVSDGTVF
jgi:Protein of unknown function (DUF1688)